jgi:large subunit ribosomal protein L21
MTEATAEKKKAPAKAAKKAPEAKSAPVKTAKKEADKFAVFATGGKQYRVSEGDTIKIEKILGAVKGSGREEYKEGDKLTFTDVLLIDNGKSEITLGTPFIKGSFVSATLNKIGKAKKIEVIKYKQKSRYFKRYGHRQPYFEIKIDSIK